MLGKSHLTINATACTGAFFLMKMCEQTNYGEITEFALKADEFFFAGKSPIVPLVLYTLLFSFGGILPDVDQRKSLIGNIIYIPLGHRGITHSIWLPGFICFIAYVAKNNYLLMLGLGYFLHLIIDFFSSRGVDWFYPIGSGTITFESGAKRTRGHFFSLYRTGCPSEYVLLTLLLLINLSPTAYYLLSTISSGHIQEIFSVFSSF